MITLIIKKEIEPKEISQKFSKECKNKVEALFWKLYYKKKGYIVEELKDYEIK